MKNLKTIFVIISILLITSCQKELNTSFTTDKTEYYQGDTVNLTNTTENGNSYIWTMPDGQTVTTENANYIIDTKQKPGVVTFKLESFSKREKQRNTISHSINVNYLPTFITTLAYGTAVEQGNYIPELIGIKTVQESNYWYFTGSSRNFETFYIITVYLPGTPTTITPGIYTLQNDYIALTDYKACIIMDCSGPRPIHKYISDAGGQLEIIISNNGTVSAVFNNVKVNNGTSEISGNIHN
ncbi:MAG: hypothetical protein V4667_02730 [Bacteroidota bacterium]